jgi:cell division protein FtsB
VDTDIQPLRTALEEEPETDPQERGGWTVSLLCAGVAIIAVCLLLPLAEENHQLAWQREKLRADLEQIQQQVAVNAEFLKKVADDPTLAERLAQRQMKFIREGTRVLDLPGEGGKEEMSPFLLVSLPPPSPMPPYQPLGGTLAVVVRNPRLRLYVTGAGLMMLACGLVLGGGAKQTYDPS